MRSDLSKSLALALMFAAVPALAWDVSLGVRNESNLSDNSARTPDDEIEEWTHQPGAVLNVQHQGPRLRVDGNYDYEKRIRSEDTFDDDSALTGTSTIIWQAIPGRLDFTVANVRTETTAQAVLPETPDNQQVSSSTRAGPTLRFKVRDVDEIQLQYLHTRQKNELDDTDAKRDTLTANYVWNVGANNAVTFSALTNKVDFDDPNAPDIDSVTSSVQWQHYGPNIDYRLLVGYTELERELGRDDLRSPVYDGEITWRITPTARLIFSGGWDLRDRSDALELGTLDFGTNSQLDTDLNEVFENTRAAIELQWLMGTNQIGLALTFDDEDYEDVLNDVVRKAAEISYQRRLSSRFNFVLLGSIGEEDFQDANLLFDRTQYGASLEYVPNRRLTLALNGTHDERESDEAPNLNFEENIIGLELQYLLIE